jgi:hypothetical protein
MSKITQIFEQLSAKKNPQKVTSSGVDDLFSV